MAHDIRRPLWWQMHVAKYSSSGRWGFCGLKDALLWEEEEGWGAEGPFPGDRSPVPFCCLVGTGTALHLPSRALGSSPLPILCLGYPGQDGGNSDPIRTQFPASGASPCARQWLRGGEASRHPAGGKGRPSQPAQGLPALHKRIADCQVLHGPFFPVPQPCPWSMERCHVFCTEP